MLGVDGPTMRAEVETERMCLRGELAIRGEGDDGTAEVEGALGRRRGLMETFGDLSVELAVPEVIEG